MTDRYTMGTGRQYTAKIAPCGRGSERSPCTPEGKRNRVGSRKRLPHVPCESCGSMVGQTLPSVNPRLTWYTERTEPP
jgi:hypothetical protein